jgi:hypothetical protein
LQVIDYVGVVVVLCRFYIEDTGLFLLKPIRAVHGVDQPRAAFLTEHDGWAARSLLHQPALDCA